MTIPWQMNCSHQDSGRCLPCIRSLIEAGNDLAKIADEYIPLLIKKEISFWNQAKCGLPYQGSDNTPRTPTKCNENAIYPDDSLGVFSNVSSSIAGSSKYTNGRHHKCKFCGKKWLRTEYGVHGYNPHVCWEPVGWG